MTADTELDSDDITPEEAERDRALTRAAFAGCDRVSNEIMSPVLGPRTARGGESYRLSSAAMQAIEGAFPELDRAHAHALALHLTDWVDEAAFIVALAAAPERFARNEIRAGVVGCLIHVPDHIAAAAKLSGHPIHDTWKLGVSTMAEDMAAQPNVLAPVI